MDFPELQLKLPEWVHSFYRSYEGAMQSIEDKMQFVIGLSRLNIKHGGGPFAAAIFDRDTNTPVSMGVNLVTSLNVSVVHAEIVAIVLAQKKLGSYDLSGEGMPICDLFSSTEPCVMCLGAVQWSGVRRLVYAAHDEDARSIGFDEGIKPLGWQESFEKIGITVVRGLLREEACSVLENYREQGGIIYNARHAGDS